jgi:hypothetical protein
MSEIAPEETAVLEETRAWGGIVVLLLRTVRSRTHAVCRLDFAGATMYPTRSD